MRRTIHLLPAIYLALTALVLTGCKPEEEKENRISGKIIKSILVASDGKKWFATERGISSFDGTNWENYGAEGGIGFTVNDLASQPGSEVRIWVASLAGAKLIVPDNQVLVLDEDYSEDNSGLLSDSVNTILEDAAGFVWMGTNRGLSGLDLDGSWIDPDAPVFSLPVTRIGSSADGWNYFTTLGGGIARNQTSAADGLTSASTYEAPWAGIPSNNVYSVYIDQSTGNQWFGTAAGVAYHVGTATKQNWTVYTTLDGLANDFVLSISGDDQGTVYFGTKGGLSRFVDGNWTTYTEAEGLASNTVYSLAVDTDGSVWAGTANGVSHLNNETIVTYR